MTIGQKLKASFYRGSFRKGVAVSIGVPGGGVWGRVKGGEGGGGVGTGKGTRKSMRKLCRNYPLVNYPLVSPRDKSRDVFVPLNFHAGGNYRIHD